jgi:hypothetical protein
MTVNGRKSPPEYRLEPDYGVCAGPNDALYADASRTH